MTRRVFDAAISTSERRPARSLRGVTLVELLIVMVVIGVLTAIALPSYSAYVVRSKRTAAKSALLSAANILERNRTANGCYNRTTMAACQAGAGSDFTLSADASAAPSSRPSYIVTTPTLTATTFTLLATPCGSAGGTCPAGSDSTFVDAECGVFGITEAGDRTVTGTAPVATCWDR